MFDDNLTEKLAKISTLQVALVILAVAIIPVFVLLVEWSMAALMHGSEVEWFDTFDVFHIFWWTWILTSTTFFAFLIRALSQLSNQIQNLKKELEELRK